MAKKKPLSRRSGASLLEYVLLVGLIAVVCISAIALFGREVSALFSRIASSVEAVGEPDGK
jgi:Flp pilus assembly pilin Flp